MSPSEHEHDFAHEGSPDEFQCACGANLWAIQTVLDEAAEDARRVAGDAHYTGCRVRQQSETLELWLCNSPTPVLLELEATRPGIYLIHNDAPRPLSAIDELGKEINFMELKREGIDIVSRGPSSDGYIRVGVLSDVPTAQTKFDAMFGPNVVRVHEGTRAYAC